MSFHFGGKLKGEGASKIDFLRRFELISIFERWSNLHNVCPRALLESSGWICSANLTKISISRGLKGGGFYRFFFEANALYHKYFEACQRKILVIDRG